MMLARPGARLLPFAFHQPTHQIIRKRCRRQEWKGAALGGLFTNIPNEKMNLHLVSNGAPDFRNAERGTNRESIN